MKSVGIENYLVSRKEALDKFKYIAKKEARRVKSRKKNNMYSKCPVLVDLDLRIENVLKEYESEPKSVFVDSKNIIGLVGGKRAPNYSDRFLPLPEDDGFSENWIKKASGSNFLDSGVISLIPVKDKYFVLDVVLKSLGAKETVNSHYYASIAKVFGKAVRATVYDVITDDIADTIVDNNKNLFSRPDVSNKTYIRGVVDYLKTNTGQILNGLIYK